MIDLPIPPHFNPDGVGKVWPVPYQERATEGTVWAHRHGIRPSSEDRIRIGLLAIHLQNTFCLPEFELFVAGRSGDGAVQDCRRLCEFVYRNLHVLTRIVATLDTHIAMQIFHPHFLVNPTGEHPSPMTVIHVEEVQRGEWQVNPALANQLDLEPEALNAHLLHYCRELAKGGKYELMVWPYHAMIGGIGHALVSAVEEAFFFHAVARSSSTVFETTGQYPLTEHYSALRPEVFTGVDGKPLAESRTSLLELLLSFDALVIGGEAKSHCVAWTVEDLLAEIQVREPALAPKVYLLEDCTSPVVLPGIADFSDPADEAFARFGAAGIHRVRSTDPLNQWPDFEFVEW